MKSILIIITFCFLSTTFCQVTTFKEMRKERKKRFKIMEKIHEAEGEISVETYFPVDTSFFNLTKLYLDSSFQTLKDEPYERDYYIYQNEIDGWEYGLLPKDRPDSIVLDSVFYDTVVEGFFDNKNSIVYRRIQKGEFVYKARRYKTHYIIEDAKIMKVIRCDTKHNRLDALVDYSSLYRKKDLRWPVYIDYDREGKIKKQKIFFYFDGYDNGGTTLIEWKF